MSLDILTIADLAIVVLIIADLTIGDLTIAVLSVIEREIWSVLSNKVRSFKVGWFCVLRLIMWKLDPSANDVKEVNFNKPHKTKNASSRTVITARFTTIYFLIVPVANYVVFLQGYHLQIVSLN